MPPFQSKLYSFVFFHQAGLPVRSGMAFERFSVPGAFTRTVVWLVLAFVIFPPPGAAGAQPATNPGKRWLFVVETSAAMQRRTEGTLQVMDSLLASEIKRQLRTGDTIGVWTFNDQIHAGRFPLKRWSPEGAATIRSEMLRFVKEQPFERQPDYVPLGAALSQVASNSPVITIIIIGSGNGKFVGTPFDESVNTVWTTWQAEQQKARMPMVTVLRAAEGHFSDHRVSPAQYALEMPPLPAPPQVATKDQDPTKPTVQQPPSPRPKAPPLIFSGRKKEPEPENASSPAEATSPKKSAQEVTEGTAAAVPVTMPGDETKMATQDAEEPAPAAQAVLEATEQDSSPILPSPEKATGPSFGLWTWILIAGSGLLLVMLSVWYMALRARRRSTGASLITMSLETNRKK
jgi:hypothetical protein